MLIAPAQAQSLRAMDSLAGTWQGIGNGWATEEAASLDLTVECQHGDFTFTPLDQCALARIDWTNGNVMATELVLPNYVKEEMHYG